jgi:hypothetical protein
VNPVRRWIKAGYLRAGRCLDAAATTFYSSPQLSRLMEELSKAVSGSGFDSSAPIPLTGVRWSGKSQRCFASSALSGSLAPVALDGADAGEVG